jgi:putative PIN family toxin of toxin-antitoxin system
MTTRNPSRIVVDTNILVASAYQPASASGRIVDALEQGELLLLISPGILREYERIIPRAVRVAGQVGRLRTIIAAGLEVRPSENPPVTEDREDDKFVAAALAGSAEYIISNDPHLLEVDGYCGLRVIRPAAFIRIHGGHRGDGGSLQDSSA